MGKVFDALKKHDKEKKRSIRSDISPGKGPSKAPERPVKSGASPRPERKKSPEINKPVMPFAGRTVPSHEGLDVGLVVLSRPMSFEAEQFKILRTNLLFSAAETPPKSVLVTSTRPGEGKSFVCANLAISIAQNINEYVLLMDCDIRKPTIHKRFGFGDVPGLTEHLAGDVPLENLFLKTTVDKLTLLPAGSPPHNPSELLSSAKMLKLLEEVKERYKDRYVIIDSPPPRLTAETIAMANHVDGILLVLRYGKTSREEALEIIEKLGRKKVVGTVFNRFHADSLGYDKYKKYNRYYQESPVKKGLLSKIFKKRSSP